jgi:hypothetical protein
MTTIYYIFLAVFYYAIAGVVVNVVFIFLNGDDIDLKILSDIFKDYITICHLVLVWPYLLVYGISDLWSHYKDKGLQGFMHHFLAVVPKAWIKRIKERVYVSR